MENVDLKTFQMSEQDYFELCEIVQSLSVSQFVINDTYNEPTACQAVIRVQYFKYLSVLKTE